MSSSNSPSNPQPSLATMTRGQKWKRRLIRISVVLLVLGLLFRLALAMLLPSAIRKAADFYGLNCEYSRAKMGLLGGYAALWDLTVTPKEGSQPIFSSEFCEASLSTWQLLHGKLVVWRVGADGVKLDIKRSADGHIALLDHFTSPPAKQPAAPQTSTEPPKELDLKAPLQVEAFRLTRVQAAIEDESVSPAFRTTINTNIRVSEIGSADRPTHLEIDVWADQLLDELRLDGDATSTGRMIDAKFRLYARGINPTNATPYLKLLGIHPTGRNLNLTANLALKTSGVEGTLDALKGQAVLSDLRLYTGRTDALRVGNVTISPKCIAPDRLDLGTIAVSDISVSAQRNADSSLSFAGIDYTGTPQAPAPIAKATTQPTAAPDLAAAIEQIPLPKVSLDELQIQNVHFAFADQAIPGGSNLGLTLKSLKLANLSTYAPATGQPKPVELNAELSADGIANTILVTGKADPFGAAKNAKLSVRVGGIHLDALKPYLNAAGLESTFQSGSFNFDIAGLFGIQPNGMLGGEFKLDDLTLSDAKELLKLSDARITGVRVDPRTLEVSVGAVEIAGPTVIGHRDRTGQLFLLGLKTRPTSPTTAEAAQTASPSPEPQQPAEATNITLPVPRIHLDRFTWKDIRLQVQDDFVQPAATLSMTDAGIEMRDLAMELRPTNRPATAGKLHAWMKFPGVIDNLDVSGSIVPTLTSARLVTDTKMTGITGRSLAPYMAAAGLAPALDNGSFQLHSEAVAQLTRRGLAANLLMQDLKLQDGPKLLAGIDQIRVEDFRSESPLTAIKTTRIVHPYLAVQRNADGSLEMMGIRVVGNATPAPVIQQAAPVSHKPAPAVSPRLPVLPLVNADQLTIEDAQIDWIDQMFTPAVQTSLKSDLSLNNLRLGQKNEIAHLLVRSSLTGSMDHMTFDATMKTWPELCQLDSQLNLAGLKGGPLEAYLPPTLATTLQDGQLKLKFQATAANNPQGGISANASVIDFDFRDGQAQQPLVSFPSAIINVNRLDPAGLKVALDELSLEGLRVITQRNTAGDIEFAGLRTATTRPAGRPVAMAPTTAPAITAPEGEREVVDLISAARKALPEISIAKLSVSADELRFTDRMRPAAAPLVIDQFHLRNTDRLAWLGKDPFSQPMNRFELAMRIDPVMERFVATLDTTPLGFTPWMQLRFNADGIHGEGINKLIPELAGKLDGSTLTDGHFQTTLDASMKVERHGPLQFDFANGFNADLALRDTTFRNGDDPQVLLGLQTLNINNVRIEPGAHRATIPNVWISKPMAYVLRDKAGLHVLGLTIPTTARSNQPTTQPVITASIQTSSPQPAPTPTPAAPSFDIQVRKLAISGMDMTYQDNAFTPAVTVPLRQLEVEVQDLGTVSLKQPRPIRFNAMMGAGKVELAKRGRGRLGAGAQTGIEQRDLFSLITANGAVSLYPQINGWAKGSINGLELLEFTGAAESQGMHLNDGLFDGEVDVRIVNQHRTEVHTTAVMTDLSVSEIPDGPIARTLKLSAPLDTTLRLLEDADGSISLPLDFTLRDGQYSIPEIVGSGLGAANKVILTAIASSPLKLVQGAANLLGADQGTGKKKSPPTVTINFAPGTATMTPHDIQQLNWILDRLRDDRNAQLAVRQELSESDLSLAAARANPSDADAMDLICSLRSQKQQLLEQRKELTVRVQTRLAASPEWAAQDDLNQLKTLDQQLASLEVSLDKLLELFRPGADRQAGRRTRGMALEIAQTRVDMVKDYLLNSDIRKIKDRVLAAPVSSQPAPNAETGRVVITLVTRKR